MTLLGNRFDITGSIGQGGMGIVLRGHDRQTGLPVAIKTLRDDVAERHPGALDRFQREAEMLRHLNHPNIIQVLATLDHKGTTYIVMEFAEGGSLAALLRREAPLPLDRVLSIALDVADAMTRVHRLGILHRDLKPENVLLAGDGTARLSDFGIAYLLAGPGGLTQEAGVFGTPHYLSPEALRRASLDARTDIWAFGVMLFEMLTGQPPFTGDLIAQIVQSVLNDRVPDLEALRPDAPAALLDLVYRMLEKDPGSRIRSVRLVGAELETLLHRSDLAQTMLGAPIPDMEPPPERTPPFALSSAPLSTARLHNIPAQTTPFVGRQEELPALARLVGDPAVRMITVLGTGGSGKTRVAQEVAIRNIAGFLTARSSCRSRRCAKRSTSSRRSASRSGSRLSRGIRRRASWRRISKRVRAAAPRQLRASPERRRGRVRHPQCRGARDDFRHLAPASRPAGRNGVQAGRHRRAAAGRTDRRTRLIQRGGVVPAERSTGLTGVRAGQRRPLRDRDDLPRRRRKSARHSPRGLVGGGRSSHRRFCRRFGAAWIFSKRICATSNSGTAACAWCSMRRGDASRTRNGNNSRGWPCFAAA